LALCGKLTHPALLYNQVKSWCSTEQIEQTLKLADFRAIVAMGSNGRSGPL